MHTLKVLGGFYNRSELERVAELCLFGTLGETYICGGRRMIWLYCAEKCDNPVFLGSIAVVHDSLALHLFYFR